ncbi:DEAD/DEAH box helicase family protein, partial [bacterium]|nr:DEAD/DEAH box helicase family protein [bacterium]
MKQSAAARAQPSFVNYCTADVRGAQTGDRLRSIRRDDKDVESISADAYASVEDVVLEVAQGIVFPYDFPRTKAIDLYNTPTDPNGLAKKLADVTGVTPVIAQQQFDRFAGQAIVTKHALLGYAGSQNVNVDNPNRSLTHGFGTATPLRFKIVSAGTWAGVSDTIQGWEASQELVDPVDLLVELKRAYDRDNNGGVGPLALRPNLFLHARPSGRLSAAEVAELQSSADAARSFVDVCGALGCQSDASEFYRVEANSDTTIVVAMPPSASGKFLPDQVLPIVYEALVHFSDLDQTSSREDARQAFDVVRKTGFGFLKSLLQKLARVRPKLVKLPGYDTPIDARVVMAVGVGLLCSTLGDGFVADLGLFVRGPTAAFKRIGVISVEDSWPSQTATSALFRNTDPATVTAALMSASLVTVRVPSYVPPPTLVKQCMVLGALMVESPNLIQWRVNRRLAREVAVPCDRSSMAMVARLLRVLRAFDGDMKMMDYVAQLASGGTIPCIQSPPGTSTSTVPIVHACDHHVFRGMGNISVNNAPPDYATRFEQIFTLVSGFNPRIAQANIDETDAIVKRVRFEQRMVGICLFKLRLPVDVDGPRPKQLSMQIDTGVLAAGVNSIPVRVSTTAAENAADGYATTAASTTWNLLVVIGVESPDPIVIHQWSAHAGDNTKKPAITATAKAKAISKMMETTSYGFSSPMLNGYSRAVRRDDSWFVTSTQSGLPDIEWNWDTPPAVTFSYTEVDLPSHDSSDPNRLLPPLTSNKTVARFLAEELDSALGPILCANLDGALREVIDQVGDLGVSTLGMNRRVVQLRLLSMLRQRYATVKMPVPGLKGGIGSDQVAAESGDWIVWRGLLWISRIAPGALRPASSIPNFVVPNAALLRHVEARLVAILESAPEPAWKEKFTTLADQLEERFGTPEIGGRTPFVYQRNLVKNMLRRDDKAVVKTPSFLCSLDTGLGKSLIGLWYSLSHLRKLGVAKRIIWFTPQKITRDAFAELQRWGMGTSIGIVERERPTFPHAINIVGVEWLSSGASREALTNKLIKLAPTSFCIFDEVHLYYGIGIRNSTLRRVASVCPKYLAMSATPIAGPSQKLAIDWLKDSVGFPINTKNQLTAAAMMVAARVQLGIDEVDTIKYADFSPTNAQAHLQALRNGRDWGLAARISREAAHEVLVNTAIELAAADRAANPAGGVLVVCDSAEDKQIVWTKLATKVPQATIGDRNAATEHDATKVYIVTVKTDSTGFNAIRLGAIVTGVYASSAASRKQLRGRIKRVGQVRESVVFATVVTKHSILALLLDRHSSVDAKNESLADLAEA